MRLNRCCAPLSWVYEITRCPTSRRRIRTRQQAQPQQAPAVTNSIRTGNERPASLRLATPTLGYDGAQCYVHRASHQSVPARWRHFKQSGAIDATAHGIREHHRRTGERLRFIESAQVAGAAVSPKARTIASLWVFWRPSAICPRERVYGILLKTGGLFFQFQQSKLWHYSTCKGL